jgi:SAM-dependent methyltransferase
MAAGPEMELEQAGCPMCQSLASMPTPYGKAPFAVRRCAECDLWFLSPRLPEHAMMAYYAGHGYFQSDEQGIGYAGYEEQAKALRETFALLLRTLDQAGAARGNLLEVGAGLGYLLAEAADHFDTVSGVEMSEDAREKAARISGATLYESLDALDEAQKFDCIIATHVIEHVYDPVAFAGRLKRHLAPGGVLVLAAPHMGSLFRKVMGNAWPSFKYPEHVSFYDEKTLRTLFERTGFVQMQRLPYPHAFPLALILKKLGLPAPGWTAGINLKLPATTVCYMGR